jgi:CelD/BcsL family acetyltransferase involved in cellulose biosynthesis
MTVQVLRSPSELGDLPEQWAALADAAGARHYAQPFWSLSWWRHFGSGELYVAAVECGGRLTALAPLYRRRHFGVDTLRFLSSDILGVSEILVAPGCGAAGDELWDFLLHRPRCLLDLRHHRFAGGGMEALRRAENHTWRAQLGPASPFVHIPGSWDDYWQSRREKFRSELERRRRRAEREQLPARVEVAVQPGDVDKRLADMTAVFDVAERAQPKLHFLAGAYRPFTIDMLERAAEQSRLALFVLYLGDRPAATSWTFRCGTRISGGGSRFDPDFRRFSPGHLLWHAKLKHAFSSGCTEVDLGPGDMPYKREWSTGSYDTLDVTAFSSRAAHAFRIGETALASSRLIQRVLK